MPLPDDDQWEELLDTLTLTWSSLDAAFSELKPHKVKWFEAPEPSGTVPYYFLAIRNAPPAKRWLLLKPYLHRLWTYHRSHDRPQIFDQLDEISDPREHDYTWSEPREFIEERKEWALHHDGEYIRIWCEKPHQLRKLATDLDWTESVWNHLTSAQKSNVLRELPRPNGFGSPSNLPEQWWQRSQMLPTRDRLDFARKHGTLADRRTIAKNWVEESIDNRLEKYQQLQPAERPDPKCLGAELDEFINNVEPSEPSEDHLCTLIKLVQASSGSIRLRLFPIYLEQRVRREIQKSVPFKDLRENLAEAPDSDGISNLAHGPKAKLSDANLRELQHQVSLITSRLHDFAREVDKADQERRLFPDISTELDAWEKRIKEALSPNAQSEPASDTDPLAQARQKLTALESGSDDIDFLTLYYSVPADNREELLRDAVRYPQLATDSSVFRRVIEDVDDSDMTTEEATEAAQCWIKAYEDSCEDRRVALTVFLDICLVLRRTELRRLFRKRTEESLASLPDANG